VLRLVGDTDINTACLQFITNSFYHLGGISRYKEKAFTQVHQTHHYVIVYFPQLLSWKRWISDKTRMKLFYCTWGVLFLIMLLVLENVAIGVKGERCSSAPLDYNGHNHGLCELLVKEALGEYRTIECRQYPSISSCISNFCRDVSSCLSQTWKWRKLCFWRFFWFRLGKFDITAWKEVQSNTSIRNLQLGYCSRTYSSSHGRWRVNYKFSIITTEYSDHSENEGSKGMNSQRLCSRG